VAGEREAAQVASKHQRLLRSRGRLSVMTASATHVVHLFSICWWAGGRSTFPLLPPRRRTDRRIGLEPRTRHARRHLEPLQDLSRSRIDSPQVAIVTLPGAVPALVDPGDPGDEALDSMVVRIVPVSDRSDDFRSDLPHPERPFGHASPESPRRRRRDRGEHAPVFGSIFWMRLSRFERVLSVESRSRMAAHRSSAASSARRIDDTLSPARTNMRASKLPHAHDRRREGPVFAQDIGLRSLQWFVLSCA